MKLFQENRISLQEDYESLERKFLDSLNFVELRRDNFSTTSIEFTKQLQSICNEIGELFLTYAILIDMFEFLGVNDFEECFNKMWGSDNDNDFIFSDISVIGLDFDISPWSDVHFLGENRHTLPMWWEKYKRIKKGIVYKSSFDSSNADLRSVLYALAALYILKIAFIEESNRIVDETDFDISSLFKVI